MVAVEAIIFVILRLVPEKEHLRNFVDPNFEKFVDYLNITVECLKYFVQNFAPVVTFASNFIAQELKGLKGYKGFRFMALMFGFVALN